MDALAPLSSLPVGETIELRHHQRSDLNLIRLASADPLIPLITTVPAVWSDQEGAAYIDRQIARPSEGLGWSLAIVDKESGTALGNLFIALHLHSIGAVEIGYWIAEPYRGRGVAAAALALVCGWAPGEFGVDRMTLMIDPANEPSLRTAARAGFEPERRLETAERVGEEWRPMIRHGIGPGGDAATVAQLEHGMWTAGFRDDPIWFDAHLHQDFTEFGRSGRRYTRADMILHPVDEIGGRRPLTDLQVEEISEACFLVTYRSEQAAGPAHRSSLWLRRDDRFLLRHHQGTAFS